MKIKQHKEKLEIIRNIIRETLLGKVRISGEILLG